MTDHPKTLRAPKLDPRPSHGRIWQSVAQAWHRKTTVTAVFAAAAILAHLILRFGVRTSADASRLPLLATLPPQVIHDR